MNIEDEQINWLFLDLNSFFASCEQQDRVELRGRPVAIVQSLTDTTCAIASSYEARAFGVKTGTIIGEAKRLCPGLVLVQARHEIYARYHHHIVDAVESCLPVAKVCSIDEMAARLMGDERKKENAIALAQKVKSTIRAKVGDRLTCSVGLGPSLFLGKVGSDMRKPDGLVVITKKDLPDILYSLELTDIYGIGDGTAARLNRAGIFTVEALMQASRQQLRQAWGSIYGALYYELLHGADLQFPSSGRTQSMSHEHVLEPELRTMEGAREFSFHLLAKAAERLRRECFFARRLGLHVSWQNGGGHYWNETGFAETQSTDFLQKRLVELWREAPRLKPFKVGVVLLGLVPQEAHQPDLFDQNPQHNKLSSLMDTINARYGRGTIGFGSFSSTVQAFKGHASFQRVPEEFEF
jgi:DNA polymerase-4